MSKYRDAMIALLVAGLIVYMTAAEMDRRERNVHLVERMNAFMSTGPRFTLYQGMMLCERLRQHEIDTYRPDPVDCSEMFNEMVEAGVAQ